MSRICQSLIPNVGLFRRNLVSVAGVVAALVALASGIWLAAQALQSHGLKANLRQADDAENALLRAAVLQTGEQVLVARLLGTQELHEKIDQVLYLRLKAESAWSDSIRHTRQIRIYGLMPVMLDRVLGKAVQAHERLRLLRERVDSALTEGRTEVSLAQWVDTSREDIQAMDALRDQIVLINPLPLENGLHAMIGDITRKLGEQIGVIDGLIGYHLLHNIRIDDDSTDRIAAALQTMARTLDLLAELQQGTDPGVPLRTAIATVERALGSEFRHVVHHLRAEGTAGHYSMNIDEWRALIGAKLDRLSEFASTESMREQHRLDVGTYQYNLALTGLIIVTLISGGLAWRGLLQVGRDADTLFLQKELAEITLNSIGDAVLTTDAGGRVQYLNPAAETLTGWSGGDARGQPIGAVFHTIDSDSGLATDPVGRCLARGEVISLDGDTLVQRNGARITVENSAVPIWSRTGAVTGCIVIFYDAHASRPRQHLLSYHVSRDALTGLVNRREFDRRLDELLREARANDTQHVLAFLDLDQFKVINDTCGHQAGDRLLRQIAYLLQSRIRSGDVLARIGGDEFAILLVGCALDKGVSLLERLCTTLADFRFTYEEKAFTIGASIGAVPIGPDSPDSTELLSEADAACYVAKEKGRNRLQVYEPDDFTLFRRRGEMRWLPRINQALDDDGFVLYAQRLQPLQEHLPERLEILVRLSDSGGQLIGPGSFIAAAERYGLMPRIDQWVIRTVYAELHDFLQRNPDVIVNINLSGTTFGSRSILDFILDASISAGVDPRQICFEVTETAAIASMDVTIDAMRRIRALGFSFSLDDFGTGLSSFSYLKALPVQQIKIGDSYVRNLLTDPLSHSIVRSVIDIGDVLGINVCAECVEDEETRAVLQHMGAGYAQGYAVQRPAPLAEVLQWMQTYARITA